MFSDFSVCLTVFNNGQTIRACLDSIQHCCPGAEIVVVDSFSTDETYSIIGEFQEVRAFRKKCSRGAGFQLAATNSSRQYLIFAAGDWIVEKSIGQLVNGYLASFKTSALLLEDKRHQISTPLLIVPRDIFMATGGFRDLQYAEDMDLHVRLAARHLLVCSDVNPFITHRREPSRAKFGINFVKEQLQYYYYLSLAGFGMSWSFTPTLPLRLLSYLLAYPRRDRSNLAAKAVGSMDIRIDFGKKLGILFNSYLPPEQFLNKLQMNDGHMSIQ